MISIKEKFFLSDKDYEKYFEKGVSYDQYIRNMAHEIESKTESNETGSIPLNLTRSRRIGKTFTILDELKNIFSSIEQKVYWLVLSEHWCGDSSQIMPAINEIVKASEGKIELKIVYRDENPELMNAHLTKESKSIPKLIQFDERFNITGEFGPRPDEGQNLVMKLKEDPLTAKLYNEILHKWYADDKSISIQRDLLKVLMNAVSQVSIE